MMKPNAKWSGFAVGLAFLGLATPAGAASYTEDLGILPVPSSFAATLFDSTPLSVGSFTDLVSFSVSQAAQFSSIAFSADLNLLGQTLAGVELTAPIELLQGNQVLATGSISNQIYGTTLTNLTTFTSTINNVSIDAGIQYSLLISGISYSDTGYFMGSLNLIPSKTGSATVPEPGQWAILLPGLLAVYATSRRKPAASLIPASA